MEEVEDGSGRRYLRMKRAEDASLVVDPTTGSRTYLPNEALTPVEGDAAGDGIVSFIAAHGPVPVRSLLDATSLCESDLNGLLTLLAANDVIRETQVAGERAYAIASENGPTPDQS